MVHWLNNHIRYNTYSIVLSLLFSGLLIRSIKFSKLKLSFINRLPNIRKAIWHVNIKNEYNEGRTLSLFQASFIEYCLLARVVSSNCKGKRRKGKIKSLIYFLYRFLHMNESLLEITTMKMTFMIHKRKVINCDNIRIY